MANENLGLTTGRVLRPAELAARLSIGLSTVWWKIKKEPNFPQPFKLSKRTTVFLETEIDAYVQNKASSRVIAGE